MSEDSSSSVAPRVCSLGHANPADSRFCGSCGQAIYPGAPPTWSNWSQAWSVVCHRPHVRAAVTTTLIVGTILFGINQLDVVIAGDTSPGVIVKVALTYIVPFCVTNVGILTATRQRAG